MIQCRQNDDAISTYMMRLQPCRSSAISRSIPTLGICIALLGVGITGFPVLASAAETKPRVDYLTVTTGRGTFYLQVVSIRLKGPWRITVDSAKPDKPDGVVSMKSMIRRRKAVAAINGAYFNSNLTAYPFYNSYSKKPIMVPHLSKYFWPIMAVDTDNRVFFMERSPSLNSPSGWKSYQEDFKKRSFAAGGSGIIQAAFHNPPMFHVHGDGRIRTDGISIENIKSRRNFIGWNSKRFFLASISRADFNDMGSVIKKMGLLYAINVDAGASTALYANGKFLLGPGHDVVNAILITKK